MTDDQIKLLCDLKELQREMILLAVRMIWEGYDKKIQVHGRELNGAAAMVGNWIREME